MSTAFQRFWKKYGRSFWIALVALYLPHLFVAWELTDGNLLWVLIMPGIFAATFAHEFLWNTFTPAEYRVVSKLVAVFSTAGLVALLTIIGAHGRKWQIAAFVMGMLYSVVAAIMMYRWFSLGSV